MNLKYILIVVCIATLFSACEKVVEVNLEPTEPRLVIDAGIEWIKGSDGSHQTIKLTQLAGFYDAEIPPVSGATVFITNSEGAVFDFTEIPETGEYVCTDFIPVIEETYELTVISGGETYTATERLVPVPEITRVEQENNGGFMGDEVEVSYFYNDNGNEENFYLPRFDTDFLPYPESYTINDNFNQGNEMFESFSHEDLAAGVEVEMSLSGISERYYNYLSIILSGGGGPFQPPSANAKGNIENLADEENYALGYFRLSEVSATTYVVEN